jgi:hypothetical protein
MILEEGENMTESDREKLNRLIDKLNYAASALTDNSVWHKRRLDRCLEAGESHGAGALFHLKKLIHIKEEEILKNHC